MTMWIVVVLAGVATFTMRYVFIGLFGRVGIPTTLERSLRYIAPAVLAALVLPAVLAPEGSVDPINPYLVAAIVGGAAAWKTKSIGAAILVGLPALWLIQWLIQ
ncbi:MAG: AzlD domain-containing protein [Acidimicrobiia bacterium]